MFSGILRKILVCAIFPLCMSATACRSPTVGAVTVTSFSTIFYPGSSTLTLVKGINDNGEVVGEYWANDLQKYHGFYYDGSNYVNTDRPGGKWNETWGINNAGTIVAGGPDSNNHYSGYYSASPYSVFNTIDFLGSNFSELFDINNSNMMVGGYGDGTYHPFIYDLAQGIYTWLGVPGAKTTTAIGINNSNYVAGSYVDFSNVVHGYLFDGTVYTTIDVPFATMTEALGLNDQGKVVGYFKDVSSVLHGFIYDALLQDFTTIDIAGSTGTRIYGINNSGQIAGGYSANSINYGFIASTVPVPPALLLFGSGLADLFGMTSLHRGRNRKL